MYVYVCTYISNRERGEEKQREGERGRGGGEGGRERKEREGWRKRGGEREIEIGKGERECIRTTP